MNLILNINNKHHKYLHHKYLREVAKRDGKSESQIIEELIETNLIKPAERFKAFEQSELKEEFINNLHSYFHEDLESMYDVIDSQEEVPTDRAMLDIYKHLYQNIVPSNGVFLELFKVYQISKNK